MALYVGNTKYKVMVGNQKEDFKVPLPYDTEVEYLRSSGTQYIDTGITYSSSDAYVIECGIAIHNSGALTGNGWDAGGLFGQLNGKPTNGDGNDFGVNIQNTYVVMTLTINAGTSTQSVLSVDVNGTTYSRGRAHSSLGTYASTYGYLLFAIRSKISVSYKASESIYYCKIEKNNILVRNFIPVRVGQVGYMYDKVSGKLFGNAGTGNFILGKDKTLPYDAEVEYLEGTGTQYIDTGLQINYMSSVVVEEKCRLAYTVTNVRQLNGSNGYGFWGCTADNKFECAGGASSTSVGTGWHDVSWTYKYESSKGHTILYVDNTKIKDVSGQNISSISDNFDIFIYAIGGRNDAAALFFCNEKIASYQLYFDNVLVRDYIPVRKNGVGYLYDKVSGQLFGNSGTGSFVIGPDVCIKPYDAEVEWLGIRQATYITTDYVPKGNDIVIETKIGFISYPTTSNYAVWFFSRSGAAYRSYRVVRNTANNTLLVSNHNTDPYNTIVTRTVENSVCTIKSEWGKITINGTEYALNTTNTGSENAAPFTIGDTNLSRGVNENIYYFKVYKGGVLKLDLIPVRVGQTGYLYDRVSRQLFGNGGTGNLVLGKDVITNEKLQRLRELGCLMWFPLNETSGLNDVIGGKSITPLYTDAFTSTPSPDSHLVKLQKNKTVTATISTGFEQSQFTDGGWTTIAQAKRYSTTDTSGNASIYQVADDSICMCLNSSATGETQNWDNNMQTSVFVCDGNGRKIYHNGTKIVDDSYVYTAPWSDVKFDVRERGSWNQFRYVYVANDLLFDHTLTEQEIAEAMEILGITW